MEIKEAVAASWGRRKIYTYQDYLDLPEDGKRYEVINGELIMVAAPNTSHQIASRNIEFDLFQFVRENHLGQVFDAPFDVVLSETTVVQPDLIFIATENSGIITEKNIGGAPDLVIEILSPYTAYYDLLEKKELYATHHVREYWIVDPQKQWIEVFVNRDGKFELRQRVEKTGVVSSEVVKGWQIDLNSIFKM